MFVPPVPLQAEGIAHNASLCADSYFTPPAEFSKRELE
jgi:hypothetical protein